jgi:hypothetical protein
MATRKIEYTVLVNDAEELDADEIVEHDAYEFSKKTFKETDNAGVYNDNPN